MKADQILQSDLLDLIFEDRNQAYGAYQLRRSYNSRMLTALGITLGISFVLSLSSFIKPAKQTTPPVIVEEVTLRPREADPLPIEPPPPPPPVAPPPPAAKVQFTDPLILKAHEVNDVDLPPELDQIEKAQIDLVSQAGSTPTDNALPPLQDHKGVLVVREVTDGDGIFMSVEIEADFPGGMGAWRKFLERNLSADVATSAAAPAGSYTVVVQFIVDKEGVVSEVKATTKHGYGMEEEAVRVIKRSGKWTPAVQNGQPVKALRKQPITFMVTEG